MLNPVITALEMTLRRAKRMDVDKLMIFANLAHVRKNWDKIPKWIEKNWCHGGGKAKGKGKPVANRETWQKIHTHMATIEVVWMWNPKGKTYQSVMDKANSMSLLHEER